MQKNYYLDGYGTPFSEEMVEQINEDFGDYLSLAYLNDGHKVTIRSPYGTNAYVIIDKYDENRRVRFTAYTADGTEAFVDSGYLDDITLCVLNHKYGVSIGCIFGNSPPYKGMPVFVTWITNHLHKKYTIFGSKELDGYNVGIKVENGVGDLNTILKAGDWDQNYITVRATTVSTTSAVQCARVFDGNEFIDDVYLASIAPPLEVRTYELLTLDSRPFYLIRMDAASSIQATGPKFVLEVDPDSEEE